MGLAAAHGVMLAYGGATLHLRPTLRAAVTLERLHDGFPSLFRKIDGFNTSAIRAVIEVSATDKFEADRFLSLFSDRPLGELANTVRSPLIELCQAFIPDLPKNDRAAANPSRLIPWADFYSELFRIATGWLHWPPETAWNATPDEITEAFSGLKTKLYVIHRTPDQDQRDTDPDQPDRNTAAGTDPEFDRAGLHALKAKFM